MAHQADEHPGARGADTDTARTDTADAAAAAAAAAADTANTAADDAAVDEQPSPGGAGRPPSGFAAVLRDAVTPRAVLLVVGVLALQVAFIASYLGAFHDPTPHGITVAVAAPTQEVAQQTAARLDALPGDPVDATAVASADAAQQQVRDRSAFGAFVVAASGDDRLYVSSAEGAAVSEALVEIFTQVEQQQQRMFTTTDLVPAGVGDARGLSAFYLAVGWVVGGYLVAAILGISAGERPANRQRALVRLGALALYSVASGLLGALVVETVLNALAGSFWPLAAFGMLLVFAVGAFTMAVQTVTGVIGIGIAVLLFVVIGNPSAGGAYPAPLLPTFWRTVGWAFPPGAGTHGIRSVVYFDNAAIGRDLLVLAAWALVGAAVVLLVSNRRHVGRHEAAAAA